MDRTEADQHLCITLKTAKTILLKYLESVTDAPTPPTILLRKSLHHLTVDPPNPPQSLAYATALIDLATQSLHSVPYKDVSHELRAAFTRASLLQCVAILSRGEDGFHGEEDLRRAVKTLDMGLLMAGRPIWEELVMGLVDAITACLDNRAPDGAITSPTASNPITLINPPTIAHPVPIATTPPPLLTFQSRLTSPTPTPLLIKNALTHWPALSTRPWSDFTYLRRIAGMHRTVPVEIGSKYTDEKWTQKLVSFGEFWERWIEGGGDEGSETPQVAYLAQHDLFSQIPRLRDDICVPDYCYLSSDSSSSSSDSEIKTNAWLGPPSTISPLHTDPHDNLFAQIVGYKYIRLYSPSQTPHLYPISDSILGNTSEVDVEVVNHAKYPDFLKAEYVECCVGPGDLLFIPRGWWHYVRGLSVSFSVSFWF
ncbi:uncharacterized protein EV422DRAFT_518430 [Fimicolochytrium jonesii]|uniref:uncharacterized protein n=1 Tax=Fimicolochytrium jonesii TaxID=1396493 RepID=UPI0022FF0659|nr:uncharacterized protein EV422DRAFT_518430 [Fimicolochytrium jonesii]KAI8823953.1 hypothetical protein EV422DRAFT_518430 [Fimicolochytrium jonesii]